jgi:ankyrin repeat protein
VIKRGQAISVNKRFTPLEYAAQAPETDALQILLEYGAKLEPDILCYTMAIPRRGSDGKISQLPHMKILVEHGADVNGWSKQHGTPLNCAVHFYRREMLEYLLEKGADPTISGHLSRTPAEKAKRDGKLVLYRILCGEKDV